MSHALDFIQAAIFARLMPTIKQALLDAKQNWPNALDLDILLCHALDKNRTYLISHNEQSLSQLEENTFNAYLKRLHNDEPTAYIIGQKEFWSLPFFVNSSVLIPRPETELLVETALTYFGSKVNLNVLELGTGSGCISLSLAHEKSNWSFTACDISTDAIEIAKKNQSNLKIENVNFIHSNWFEHIKDKYDLIISNPPYIAENDSHLQKLKFEPTQALVAKNNGLSDLKKIICDARSYLNDTGLLMLEHGYDQSTDVQDLFKNNHYSQIKSIHDLQNHPRITLGIFSNLS